LAREIEFFPDGAALPFQPGLFNALSERDVADSAVRDVFSLSEGKPV